MALGDRWCPHAQPFGGDETAQQVLPVTLHTQLPPLRLRLGGDPLRMVTLASQSVPRFSAKTLQAFAEYALSTLRRDAQSRLFPIFDPAHREAA